MGGQNTLVGEWTEHTVGVVQCVDRTYRWCQSVGGENMLLASISGWTEHTVGVDQWVDTTHCCINGRTEHGADQWVDNTYRGSQ